MRQPLFVPIDWRTIRDTLRDWVDLVTGCETIWADGNGPQPAYPFASLNILPGTRADGALDEQRVADDGSLVVVGPRDFVLSAQIHVSCDGAGDPLADARIRADALVSSLAFPQFSAELGAANIGIRSRGQPQTLDLIVGSTWIKRAQVDFRFGTTSVVDASAWPDLGEVGWFDKIEVTSEIEPLPAASALLWTNEVLDPNA